MPRPATMPHLLAGENFAIITARSNKFPEPNHFYIANTIVEAKCGEASTQSTTFPLYLYPGVGKAVPLLIETFTSGKGGRIPNLDPKFVHAIEHSTGMPFAVDREVSINGGFSPHDVLIYIYAVFHSPEYRRRFEPMLRLDYPRVPIPDNRDVFLNLVPLGGELLALHLMESPKVSDFITTYTGPKNPQVGRVGWSAGTVWLDAAKTSAQEGHRASIADAVGIEGIPEQVWDFRIGGYQVCHKWLKDRKGRILSEDDLTHYQKIVVALNETIRIMDGIDEVIDEHGGWPNAFHSSAQPGDVS